MYKLIAIDLDGTMLNKYGAITQETKEAIKKVQNEGKKVIIASGRPSSSVVLFAKEIESYDYYISGNGAIIYDMKNKRILYENALKKQKVLDIIKICEENSIYYNVYTENEIIAKSLQANVLFYYKENLNKSEDEKTTIYLVDDIYNYLLEKEEKVIKITICDEHKTIFESIIKKIKEIEEVSVLEVEHMARKSINEGIEEVPVEYYYTEVSALDAIKYLSEYIGITPEEIVTIGDNENDRKMIENAGLGIVMGQAPEYMKKIADRVTLSNDENGVAKVLRDL